TCSMSAAAPAIRRRSWAGSPARWWRWRRTRRWRGRGKRRVLRPGGGEGRARQAKEELAATGGGRATVAIAPLTAGWPAAAPYDVILLNGATEVVPETLGRQLKPDGRLACIFGRGPTGKAMIYRLIEGQLVGR